MRFAVIYAIVLVLCSQIALAAIVANDVSSTLAQEDSVSVIVRLSPGHQSLYSRAGAVNAAYASDIAVKRQFSIINGFSATVTGAGLQALQNNPFVESVSLNYPVRAFLQQADPIVNATTVRLELWDSQNITGKYQTVCVIDTGVDYTHPDLGSCDNASFLAGNCTKVLSGYDFVNDDANPIDDHGHGTHVAGIVASTNYTYKGMAPNATIVALKVLDNTGNGNTADIISAIEWCTSNASKYNITVISMSLGTTSLYSTVCDSEPGLNTFRDAVNNAVAGNISVVAASGNDGNYTAMAAPACIANATSVGATYDANVGSQTWAQASCTDSATSSDNITCFTDRASFLDLLAPGSVITSTKNGGGFEDRSGTSMAAPMVSGVIALLRQYKSLEGLAPKLPSYYAGALKSTGTQINDTQQTNLNFSRINAFAALQAIDQAAPEVTLNSPVDRANLSSGNISYLFTANDVSGLKNASLWYNGTGVWAANTTNTSALTNNQQATLNPTNLSEGIYAWNVQVCDLANITNCGFAANYTFVLDTTAPNVSVILPAAGMTQTTENLTIFAVANDSLSQVINVSVQLFNSSTNVTALTPIPGVNRTSGSGNWSIILNLSPALDGPYNISLVAYDYAGNIRLSLNTSITVDYSFPDVSLISPQNGLAVNLLNLTFNYSTSAASGISNASLWANFTGNWQINASNDSMISNSSTNLLFTNETPEGIFRWNVQVCDENSKCSFSGSNYTLIVDRTSPSISFAYPTPSNNSFQKSSSLAVNASVSDNNFRNVTFYLFDQLGNLVSNVTSAETNLTYSELADGNYSYNVTAVDVVALTNSTGTRTVVIDTASPNISFSADSVSNNTYSRNPVPVFVNVTAGDLYLANISFFLYNATSLVNMTNLSGTTSLNFSAMSQFSNNSRYFVNATAYDLANNLNSTLSYRITFDNTSPVVANDSLSSASITTGGSVTIYVNASDNFDIASGLVQVSNPSGSKSNLTMSYSSSLLQYSATYSSTSTAGTYTMQHFFVNDSAGNAVTLNSSLSFVASSPPASPSPSGGGGGGGSSSSSSTPSTSEIFIFSATPRSPKVIDINNDNLDITSVVVNVNSAVEDADLHIKKILSLSGPQPTKPVYQFYELDANEVLLSALNSLSIKFRVPASWYTAQGYLADDVVLKHLAGSVWQDVDTRRLSADSQFAYYQATVNSLSVFAISIREPPAVPKVTTAAVSNVTVPAAGSAIEQLNETEAGRPSASSINRVMERVGLLAGAVFLISFVMVGTVITLEKVRKAFSGRRPKARITYERAARPRAMEAEGGISKADEKSLAKYIKSAAKGDQSKKEIELKLETAGWPESVVEDAMHDVKMDEIESMLKSYSPPDSESHPRQLEDYIYLAMTKSNQSKGKIRRNLRNVGWSSQQIDDAFKAVEEKLGR